MWQVYLAMVMSVLIVSILWVNGIVNIHEKYPDYKGDEFSGFDFDDQLEKQQKI